jgi:hypothetical protein
MHPIQTEMLARLIIEDRQREAARLRAGRAIHRRVVPTWRSRIGGLLVRTGLALQRASRAQRATASDQIECPQLAADPR